MNPPRLAVQYLEHSPRGGNLHAVRARLRAAAQELPIDAVLVGWDLPRHIEEGLASETNRLGIPLYRWQPLLTGARRARPPDEWRVTGADAAPVSGYGRLTEFTFLCPNRQEVYEWVLGRLDDVLARGYYQGVFFDRIRFPSPTANPARDLACFCPTCRRQAAEAGLDLNLVARELHTLLKEPSGAKKLMQALFASSEETPAALQAFFTFRQASITRFVGRFAQAARKRGLAVGLDCFSPCLTHMVGQDLAALDACCDWIKVMTYPRVFGPAGLAFEMSLLVQWLTEQGLTEPESLQSVGAASGLSLPSTLQELGSGGLDFPAIALEIRRGRAAPVRCLLAGIALVTVPNVHTSSPAQLQHDLQASLAADGLVLSWDLWHIPRSVLALVQDVYSPHAM